MAITQRVRTFRDLTVWQRAMDLVRRTYRVTDSFPKREWYGLTAQMRRAAISVAANIAEGRGRFTTKEFIRFLQIATGSLREFQTYCDLIATLGYATPEDARSLIELSDGIGGMLSRLAASLRNRARA